MEQDKVIFVLYLVSLLSGVTPARVDFLRYFEIQRTETKSQEEQPSVKSEVPKESPVERAPDGDAVLTSVKDADYRLSYAEYEMTWQKFKIEHNRNYTSAREERARFAIFMDTVKTIERHNWRFHNGLSTYWMDINQFSDWTEEEWKVFTPPLDVKPIFSPNNRSASVDDPPSVDWRKAGYVTPVKNQGACGSCYAFSSTGAVEGQWFKKTGYLLSLSEQQIVDCSSSYGNNGCSGGNQDNSFRYIINKGGIQIEGDYPYTAKKGSCRFQSWKVKARISGYNDIYSGSELSLRTAVADVGPIAVLIAASDAFKNYKGGIFVDNTCQMINHAVLVVGYGSTTSQDYWIVKNSWGTGWGEKGYIQMARNRGNMCKIATVASYPLV